MITMGIRAEPSAVTFAVYDSNSGAIVNVEELKIPYAFEVPDSLKYVRNNILDVLREYKVDRAGVRITEPNADASHIRVQIEGVIQEAFASSDLDAYYVGQISSISAKLGIDRADFKPLVAGEKEYKVENWKSLGKNAREAVLCAIGAVNA